MVKIFTKVSRVILDRSSYSPSNGYRGGRLLGSLFVATPCGSCQDEMG